MGAERRYMVYGIGNGLVDQQVKVTDSELEDLRLHKGYMELTEQAEQGRILAYLGNRESELHAGGSAANTMVGMAQMGGTVAYTCALAADELGRYYADDFARLGIRLTGTPKPALQTGLCLVLVTPDGERTLKTYLGASAQLTPADIDAEMIAQSQWLYLEGYLLAGDATRAASFHALKLAQQHGTHIAFSFSDGFLVANFGAHVRKIVTEYADLIFANELEAAAYTGMRDPQASLARILQDCDNACVTCSENGSYIHYRGETCYVPAFPVQVVDLTGAGDMYAAGVLYGLVQQAAPERAARLGARAAAYVVRQMGARLPGNLLETVHNMLGSQD
ncbi:MAG TPA: adenosine kinase [Candidatus Tectomicrobia bacterium]